MDRINCIIQYHQRKMNFVVDAVSKKSIGSLVAISVDQRQLLEDVSYLQVHFKVWTQELICQISKQNQTQLGELRPYKKKYDLQLVQLIEEVKKGGKTNFVLSNDELLRFRTRLCASNDGDLMRKLLKNAHCSGLAIHLRETKMYKDLRQNY